MSIDESKTFPLTKIIYRQSASPNYEIILLSPPPKSLRVVADIDLSSIGSAL